MLLNDPPNRPLSMWEFQPPFHYFTILFFFFLSLLCWFNNKPLAALASSPKKYDNWTKWKKVIGVFEASTVRSIALSSFLSFSGLRLLKLKGWIYHKVHIFWEGHKMLRNLYRRFDLHYIGQIYGGDFSTFCGLLRICEL